MATQNEFAGVVPQVVHPKNEGETTISEYIEKIEDEVALDSYVKPQTSNSSAFFQWHWHYVWCFLGPS
jgi:hypothetical protein